MNKTIPQLNPVPGGVLAANLFFEVARQITAGNFNGESERISGDVLVALLVDAGASVNVNLIQRLNPAGVYSSTTTYTLYDFVFYQGGHYAYIGASPSAGHNPPDAAHWLLISQDGATPDVSSFVTTPQLSSAIAAHAATDSHAIYLTQAEAAALFSPIGGDAQGGLRYNYVATTGTATTGQIRFNNANLASVTALSIHESDRNSTSQSEILDVVAVGTRIQVALEDNEEIYAWFRVSGAVVDNGSDRTIPVALVSFAGTFVAGEVTVDFLQIQGATFGGGATGLKFTLNTTAGTPTTGEIRSSNLAAGGTIAINPTDTQANASDILGRLGAGAIVHLGKDGANWVRGTVTTEWTALSGSFAIGDVRVAGAIANAETVCLSIASDAPSSGSGMSGGAISATASGDTITLAQTVAVSGFLWPPILYDWYRATIDNFTFAQATKIAADQTAVDYSNTGLTTGTYYYRRVAKDQLGMLAASPIVFARATSSSFDADTITAINAVEATGVMLTGTQKTAANNFIVALKNPSNGTLWAKAKGLYLLLGGTAAAHAINWKTPGTNNITWTGTGLVHDNLGVKGNGTAYGLSGFLSANADKNSNGIGLYIKSTPNSRMMGVFGASNASKFQIESSGYANYSPVGLISGSQTGSIVNSRNNALSYNVFKNGVRTQVNEASVDLGSVGENIALLATGNTSNSGFDPSTAQVGSFVIFNAGLSDDEGIAYTNLDLAYQTELSRS